MVISMKKEEYVDLEKITKSLEVLSSMDNIMNYGSLDAFITDIEELFRQINFEHANCLKYKEQIDSIDFTLQTIKRKIFELTNSLRSTQLSYGGINSYDANDVKELIANNRFKFTNNMTTSLSDISKEIESNPIDPLPIAMAVGVTGIAGTLGAVVMDKYYSKKEEDAKPKELELESYFDGVIDDDSSYKSTTRRKKEELAEEETGSVSVGSYRAARMENANRSFSDELVEDNYYE